MSDGKFHVFLTSRLDTITIGSITKKPPMKKETKMSRDLYLIDNTGKRIDVVGSAIYDSRIARETIQKTVTENEITALIEEINQLCDRLKNKFSGNNSYVGYQQVRDIVSLSDSEKQLIQDARETEYSNGYSVVDNLCMETITLQEMLDLVRETTGSVKVQAG